MQNQGSQGLFKRRFFGIVKRWVYDFRFLQPWENCVLLNQVCLFGAYFSWKRCISSLQPVEKRVVRLTLLEAGCVILPMERMFRYEDREERFLPSEGMSPSLLSYTHERSTCYVRDYSLGNCHYSRRALVTWLACLPYRRRIHSSPSHCGRYCLAV